MLTDRKLQFAVHSIPKRSERQLNVDKLVQAFVDVGFLSQLRNRNNQIIDGRRGTGKTHALKVLEKALEAEADVAAVYIDCRTIGSSAQFSDPSLPLPSRCIALFRDLLGEVHDALVEHVLHLAETDPSATPNWEQLDGLATVISHAIAEQRAEQVSRSAAASSSSELSGDASIGDGVGIDAHAGRSASRSDEVVTTYAVVHHDKIIFPEVFALVRNILEGCDSELYILVDEWAEIPRDLQPYLAEFVKKSFFANPRVTLKIATLDYRSTFGTPLPDGKMLGFEVGSDISSTLDLDDFFVYDRNPRGVCQAFAEILFRHLRAELPAGYLADALGVDSPAALLDALFTSADTFTELVRAAEGVVRDFLNVFQMAFADSLRWGRDSVHKRSVIEGARQWYEKDKAANLTPQLRQVLARIVNEVIGDRRARSFLLPKELEKHPTVQKLFDYRVLHLMERAYADKDNPGVRYNIYTLDYGTYVDLLNTSRQPEVEMARIDAVDDAEARIVPFDDKRSIRRIVLTPNMLE